MDHPIWHALCKQPTLKASSGKYAQLVYDSTTQLHQSLEPILSALNQRAIGLTKCANYDAALRDAKVMQELSPYSALGYIRAATIYSEQGKQCQVISICDKGLSIVDTMDTHYATLHRMKADAERRQNIRINFMGQLPLDIVITTLIPLFMDGDEPLHSSRPTPYLDVSHAWRDRITQCLDGLHFEIGDDEDANPLQLVQLARHIKTLHVYRYSTGTWLGDLLCNHDFSSLKELTIAAFSANFVDHLVSSLKSIGSTLTHFTIEKDYGSVLPIADILTNCINLVYLDINQPFAAHINSLPMTTWPNITTLMLFSKTADLFTCGEIRAIGKRFPSLKKLQFSPCQDMEATRIVMDYYPWMTNLELYEFPAGFNIIFREDGPRCKEGAITSLEIDIHDMEEDRWESAIYILQQHHQRLEYLNFHVDSNAVDDRIYNIEYPCLKKLHLRNSGQWIPRNAPMLEELGITCFTYEEESTVPDAVSPRLKKLELDLHLSPQGYNISQFTQYIHRYAHHPQLKELIIHLPESDSIDNLLTAIHHLCQLERLVIRFSEDWDATLMHGFLDGLVTGCPNLSSLGIGSINAPSTHSMIALKGLEHLQHLGFSIEDVNDEDDFWHAIQTFPHLKAIHVYPVNATTIHSLGRLQKQRPDLKIVEDRWFIHLP
ncbi:predicted protein [Lichtheimia corymbifera JMRC:FSU:9682]|uniref:F-box domain-containing protein n=1 Tax=Lichtheimia corymbifera JMRC:FSU:9682 TaxID=1263082 RepID=A0A068S6Q7_9FUNG|nr:predicted protein [Lichtheimia corymbifera JMRC:FSU:9682]